MAKNASRERLSEFSIHVQLGESLYRELEETAKALDRSKSWVMRQLAKDYLAEMRPKKPEPKA